MYVDKFGRQWTSEEAEKHYHFNGKRLLKGSLAIECYADLSGDDSVYQDEAFDYLKYYRVNRAGWDEKTLIQKSDEAVAKFDKLFEKIGKENFIFYDDGDVDCDVKINGKRR